MTELILTALSGNAEEIAALETSLDQFRLQTRINVNLRKLSWDTARTDLNNIAIHYDGTDVSAIGSTWLRGLVDMNALYPFSDREIARLGGTEAFVPAAWQSTQTTGSTEVWAIPWVVDMRILYYRRDLIKQAGINEATAFATPAACQHTLAALRTTGVEVPLALGVGPWWTVLHVAASWIWEAGGAFVSADGRELLFNRPEARTGLKAYFDLRRHLGSVVDGLVSDIEADRLFTSGKAAATISGPWLFRQARQSGILSQVGVAAPVGPPFVGGVHLVLWQRSHHQREALRLIRFLTHLEFQRTFSQVSLLPAKREALSALNYADRPFAVYLEEALVRGRSLPTTYLWGIVEEHLTQTLGQIWKDVLDDAAADLDAILDTHLTPLERRLQTMLTH
ncbi:MAG: extracellular solute-binding protein [Anaerolineae bacterium]|nr:extracellular solute-binding protein [Anaerolineae bacterium]